MDQSLLKLKCNQSVNQKVEITDARVFSALTGGGGQRGVGVCVLWGGERAWGSEGHLGSYRA